MQHFTATPERCRKTQNKPITSQEACFIETCKGEIRFFGFIWLVGTSLCGIWDLWEKVWVMYNPIFVMSFYPSFQQSHVSRVVSPQNGFQHEYWPHVSLLTNSAGNDFACEHVCVICPAWYQKCCHFCFLSLSTCFVISVLPLCFDLVSFALLWWGVCESHLLVLWREITPDTHESLMLCCWSWEMLWMPPTGRKL